MSTTQRDALLQSLATTIADYRYGEIPSITPEHVETWLDQFDNSDQFTILSEMDRLMKRFYFSKLRVKEYLRSFIRNVVVGQKNPAFVLTRTHFLHIQTKGDSQRAMLAIVDDILQEDYQISIDKCGGGLVDTYIYVDDALYTGNRLCLDLIGEDNKNAWLLKDTPNRCEFIIFIIAAHQQGMNYVERKIRPICREKNIRLTCKWSLFVDNSRFSNIEYLYAEKIADNGGIDAYIHELLATSARYGISEHELFRRSDVLRRETFFSSLEARNIVERDFLRHGARIIAACKNPDQTMRPLGYNRFVSLGFGTMFVTYRNIANNCPLVLWWGDKTKPSYHPFSIWYPLFPRTTNSLRNTPSYDILDDIDRHPF